MWCLNIKFFLLILWNSWLHGSGWQKFHWHEFILVNSQKTLSNLLYEHGLWSSSHWKQWPWKIPFDFTGTLNSSDYALLKYYSWEHNKVLAACQPWAVWARWFLLAFVKVSHKWTPLCHIKIHNLTFFWFCVCFLSAISEGQTQHKG